MRAGARLGWRVATAVVFGATAALAVIVSRGAPMSAALIAAKGDGAQHAAATANPAVVQCATSGLRVSLTAVTTRTGAKKAAVPKPSSRPGGVSQAQVSAALTRYRLDFTNMSHTPCTMAGYPQVAADRNGVEIGGAAAQDTAVAAHRILLAPGQTVHASLDATQPTARCHPVRASGLRVVPPGETSARYLHRPLTACTARGHVYLHVRAIQAGAGAGTAGSG
jgi:hypothetical protein